MPADRHARARLEPGGVRRERREPGASPRRNVHAAVRTRHDPVRISAGRQALDDTTGAQVDDGERVREVLGDVEPPPIRRNRHARWVADPEADGALGIEPDAVRERGRIPLPGVPINHVLAASGRIERPPVAGECETEKGRGLDKGLSDPPTRRINDLEALLAVSTQERDHPGGIRTESHRERHRPEFDRGASRVQDDAGWKPNRFDGQARARGDRDNRKDRHAGDGS